MNADSAEISQKPLPTVEYCALNLRRPFHPAWAALTIALAALPYIGWYSKRTLEAFHPLDVPPWNGLLGNAAAGCLALGVIASPISIILAVIGLIRFRGMHILQAISLLALLSDVWVVVCFFYLLF